MIFHSQNSPSPEPIIIGTHRTTEQVIFMFLNIRTKINNTKDLLDEEFKL